MTISKIANQTGQRFKVEIPVIFLTPKKCCQQIHDLESISKILGSRVCVYIPAYIIKGLLF